MFKGAERVSWKDPHSRREIVYLLTMLVPVGHTVTYSVLAELTGTSPRAIGAYMRANKDIVVVPCHRVVSKTGLGGYSRGLEFKKKLLKIEGAITDNGLTHVIRSVDQFWRVVEEAGEVVTVIDDP
ncbi:hypothetical protein PYJP_10470 [Pyrofollis japonicus]|nr:hypothetical protein PYJP_10470 [Pyrofollis japonicus]